MGLARELKLNRKLFPDQFSSIHLSFLVRLWVLVPCSLWALFFLPPSSFVFVSSFLAAEEPTPQRKGSFKRESKSSQFVSRRRMEIYFT
jgi:hypothetical protein